jgi:acylphosphatase
MLLEDHTRPIDQQLAGIIELNAHGAIGTGQYPMWGPPRPVARAFFESCAKQCGVALRDHPAENLSVKLTVRGRVTGVGYRRWLRCKMRKFGIKGNVVNEDKTTVVAVLNGKLTAVAALANSAVRGARSALPTSVLVEHIASENDSKSISSEAKPQRPEEQVTCDLQGR